MRCGHCHKSEQCHHINGKCMNGCDSGYQGSICMEGKICIDVASELNLKVPINVTINIKSCVLFRM